MTENANNSWTAYVDQYATTYPDGTLRHIARTVDDSEDATKHYTNAREWYDLLKPEIQDPFYISCNNTECALHLDHSRNMSYPCVLVIPLPDCASNLLVHVVEQVTHMKEYLFHHWMRDNLAAQMRASNSGMSVFCANMFTRWMRVTVHSRILGTFLTWRISDTLCLSIRQEELQCKAKEELEEWARICTTRSVHDLKHMPRYFGGTYEPNNS